MRKSLRLNQDNRAISILFDTLFFLVLISLAAAILAPSLYSMDPIQTTHTQKHMQTATTSLHALLSSRVDTYTYRVGGTYLDQMAEGLGVNISNNNSLFHIVSNWILGREQIHKTYEQLILENLPCQYSLYLSENTSFQLNCFTQDYTESLRQEIHKQLELMMHGSYSFNFTASWYPIKGFPFGGVITTGDAIPNTDTYSASKQLSIPVLPKISIQNKTFFLTAHTFRELIDENLWENISSASNISLLLDQYQIQQNNTSMSQHLQQQIKENITQLLKGFFINGIKINHTQEIFPGLLDYFFDSVFFRMITYFQYASNTAIEKGIDTNIDYFNDLTSTYSMDSIISYLINYFINHTIENIKTLQNQSIDFLNDAYYILKDIILQELSKSSEWIFKVMSETIIDSLLDTLSSGNKVYDIILTYLSNQIQLTNATVHLTIWRDVV